MGNKAYLRKIFGAYYAQVSLTPPSEFRHREFAFLHWDRRGMFRHKGFFAPDDLAQYLVQSPPRHAYVSAALYDKPDAPDMHEKGWRGCDLVFDIDCDHIPTSCKVDHDSWTCKGCGYQDAGEHPARCPECGHTRFDSFTWICDECLEVSKTETIKLIQDFLIADLGLSLDDLTIVFSGHRGYHVHVELEAYRALNQDHRREISDYINAIGLSFHHLGLFETNRNVSGFQKSSPGWRGKIARFLENYLTKCTRNALVADVGLSGSVATSLIEERHEILRRLHRENDNWTIKGIGLKSWQQLCEYAVSVIHPEIDIPVTLDTHRLIRLVDSLHGKTGFQVQELSFNQLVEFDPFKDPLVFGDVETAVVMTRRCPSFRIVDEMYGPFDPDEQVSLPASAAVLVLCKGVADIP